MIPQQHYVLKVTSGSLNTEGQMMTLRSQWCSGSSSSPHSSL